MINELKFYEIDPEKLGEDTEEEVEIENTEE